jgi:excisionase family DNA binding protein
MSSNTVYMELAGNTTPKAPEEGDWLTVAEFAALFRVQPQTIYTAIAAGKIEGVIRIGDRRGTRIPAASVEPFRRSRLVASQQSDPTAPSAA